MSYGYNISFIGRQDELNTIKESILNFNELCLVFIDAPGGIGKTRLLQEILESENSYTKYLVKFSQILDFDDRTLHDFHSFLFRLVQNLKETSKFSLYIEELKKYHKKIHGKVSYESLNITKNAAIERFVECFNNVSKTKRIVILIDTIEALKNNFVNYWEEIGLIISKLENSLFVFSGRNAKSIEKIIKPILKSNTFEYKISLQPLSIENIKDYILEKQRIMHIPIDSSITDHLVSLSAGNPILLDLAIDWIVRERKIDWIHECNIEDIQNSENNKIEFEKRLVTPFLKISTMMDRLILLLAHIYPLDINSMSYLLDISQKNAKKLLKEAEDYVFIKKLPDNSISLHDKMRSMIEDYVWPKIDSNYNYRKRDRSLAAKYYKNEVQKIENIIKELMPDYQIENSFDIQKQMEFESLRKLKYMYTLMWIENELFNSFDDGFELYNEFFNISRDRKYFQLAEQLQNLIEQNTYSDSLNIDQKVRQQVNKARLLGDKNRFEESKKILHELLIKDENIISKRNKANILNALARCELNDELLNEALDHQKQSMGIFQELNETRHIPSIANHIGQIYQEQGDWENSKKYYKIAMLKALEYQENESIVVSILNRNGYLLALEGKHEAAIHTCNTAIEICNKFLLRNKKTECEIYLGDIYRRNGQYDQGINILQNAINKFNEDYETELKVLAYFFMGFNFWFKGWNQKQYKIDRTLIEKAKDSFNQSLMLAERHNHNKQVLKILHERSHVHQLLGDINQAIIDNNQSYDLAKKQRNYYYIMNALVGKAEFDFLNKNYQLIPSYLTTMKEKYSNRYLQYPLFYGRLLRIIGDVNYIQNNFQESLDNYAISLEYISKHGGYGGWSLNYELSQIESKLCSFPPKLVNTWCKTLINTCKDDEQGIIIANWFIEQAMRTSC